MVLNWIEMILWSRYLLVCLQIWLVFWSLIMVLRVLRCCCDQFLVVLWGIQHLVRVTLIRKLSWFLLHRCRLLQLLLLMLLLFLGGSWMDLSHRDIMGCLTIAVGIRIFLDWLVLRLRIRLLLVCVKGLGILILDCLLIWWGLVILWLLPLCLLVKILILLLRLLWLWLSWMSLVRSSKWVPMLG